MAVFVLPSLVSLLIQGIGALLFGTLCLVLSKTIRREPLVYWSAGWFALASALAALFLSFGMPSASRLFQPLYILGEYLFAYLVIAGCRRFVAGVRPARQDAWLLVPGGLVAVFLPWIGGGDFNVFFTVHTLIYAYLFFAAFRVLRGVWPRRGSGLGIRVMKIALLLLAIDYAHYAPLFAASSLRIVPPTLPYLEYSPLYDLMFLVLLAFGMVMTTTGEVQYELEIVNKRLGEARDRLEAMVQLDHLTSALNRHAFYSIIGDSRSDGRVVFRGCAAVADIDNLKRINDRYGHSAGDGAIRAVASAIRSCIRADDLLFRWGGDEFLVLLIGITESDARGRLDVVNQALRRTIIQGVPEPVDVSVSVGFAPFESAASLDEVIALADIAMYDRKRTATDGVA
jgi:diguanylate cyclase (GGDEF)-like protein